MLYDDLDEDHKPKHISLTMKLFLILKFCWSFDFSWAYS